MAKTGAVFGWLDSNFIFTAGALFCWGLVLSHNLVDDACTSVIMVFYMGNQKMEHMVVAAILVSLQEGLTSISAILLARIKDVHKGRFYAIFLSTSSYIAGLTLFWSYAKRDPKDKNLHIPQYLLASLLLAVGKGGTDPLLKSFLSDQLIENDNRSSPNKEEEKRLLVCKNIWWQSGRYGGAVVAIFAFLGYESYRVQAIALIMMGSFLSVFICGFFCYRQRDQNNNSKWVELTHISQSSHEQKLLNANTCHVKNYNMKHLLILTCIGYSMILGTGKTFFETQGELMGDLKINDKKVRFSLFIVIKTFISHITILAFWLCGAKRQKVMLTRIGAGMIFAVITCIIAWKMELQRQSDARLSMLWMCPQYVLLGLVEGLAQSGLEKLFENESLRNLWGNSKEVVSCLGNFLNIPCILIFRSWFKNFGEDHSHLDRYYIMLAVLSSLFLCIYVGVAIAYAKRTPENVKESRATIAENGC
ncbi:hypothetical protein L6164_002210 [Bauhinia variegata]|uniref:Uncharacterized protein n=1 Tax=Bauhinia variegata TaxID=167791 RepID=A0ACB9PWY9_BAUVA|nr:hypothetical protein L6164_002210 [Bauhinia variegata]